MNTVSRTRSFIQIAFQLNDPTFQQIWHDMRSVTGRSFLVRIIANAFVLHCNKQTNQKGAQHSQMHRNSKMNERQRITNQIGHPLILIRYQIKRVEIQIQEQARCEILLFAQQSYMYSCCCCCRRRCRHETVCQNQM